MNASPAASSIEPRTTTVENRTVRVTPSSSWLTVAILLTRARLLGWGPLGWLDIAALLTLLCAGVNLLRGRQLWARPLLTPFTDDVQLSTADQRSYTDLATTQQIKGFEHIDVRFEDPP